MKTNTTELRRYHVRGTPTTPADALHFGWACDLDEWNAVITITLDAEDENQAQNRVWELLPMDIQEIEEAE